MPRDTKRVASHKRGNTLILVRVECGIFDANFIFKLNKFFNFALLFLYNPIIFIALIHSFISNSLLTKSTYFFSFSLTKKPISAIPSEIFVVVGLFCDPLSSLLIKSIQQAKRVHLLIKSIGNMFYVSQSSSLPS